MARDQSTPVGHRDPSTALIFRRLVYLHRRPPMKGRFQYKHLVAAVFVLGLFMDLLDTTITNVALPTLSRQFGAPATSIEWVVTGYLLGLAVFIPVSGWAADR